MKGTLFRAFQALPKLGPQLNRNNHSFASAGLLARYTAQANYTTLSSVKVQPSLITTELQADNGPSQKLQLHNFWLRENCQCNVCYNHETFQRQVETQKISPTVYAVSAAVVPNSQSLSVLWSDNHTAIYPATFFEQHFSKKQPHPRVFWDSSLSSPPEISHAEMIPNNDQGRKKFLTLLHEYGFVLVTGVPHQEPKYTEEVITAVGPIQQTFYGGLWNFSNEALEHGDTAYTNLAIGLHTDGTYFHSPPGLQFLHNVEHTGTGGLSMLSDGFHLSERLRVSYPDTYHYLTTNKIKFWYRDAHEELFAEDYVIRLNKEGKVVQFRWNDLDRFPPSLPHSANYDEHYHHITMLASALQDPKYQFQFKLRPGMLLAMDNWRLLHARTSFTGVRTMVGAYIQRDTYESRCRKLGINIDE